MVANKPEVAVITTGGTIANPPNEEGYLSGPELIETIPQLSDIAEITVHEVSSVGSSEITPSIWDTIQGKIHELANEQAPPNGIVVTHGSNTVEETAYFLNLILDTDIPVILTAAQRKQGTLGNDGDQNLLSSARVAVDPKAVGKGTLIVVNDEIHHARDARKLVSLRPDAWASPNTGAIGLVDQSGHVQFYREPTRPHTTETPFDVSSCKVSDLPYTAVVYTTVFDDGRVIDAVQSTAVEGLVLAALPTGRPARPQSTTTQKESLLEIAENIPVVMSHRGIEGWPNPDLKSNENLIWGDNLSPQKAALLLSLSIQATTSRSEIQTYFETY